LLKNQVEFQKSAADIALKTEEKVPEQQKKI
jgi:hypothetical protein